jgi:hypothetical protein
MTGDECPYSEALVILGVAMADLDGDGRSDPIISGNRWCGGEVEPHYPFIRWRLRGTGRDYGEPRTFQYPVDDASYQDLAVSERSGGSSIHVAANYIPFGGYYLTQLFRYDGTLGNLEMEEATLPGRRPLFAYVDGDAYQDLVLTGILVAGRESTEIWRGTADEGFVWTQTLRAAGLGGFGQVLEDGRPEFISVRRTSGVGHYTYPLAVWENISDPTAGVPEGDPGLGPLRVHPTVSSDRVRIELPHAGETVFGVQVTDVLGRDVRHLNFKEVGGSWDLRGETGTRVAPGVYWLRAMPRGGSSARVIVVR